MLSKSNKLTFYKADLLQYNYIIEDPEIRNKVSIFLLKYISAEGFYKKLLVAEKEKNGKKLTSGDKKNLTVRTQDIKRVLDYFETKYDDSLIERIFGSNDKNYMDCSIKKLRDRLVHKVNENVIRAILDRSEQTEKDIDSFFLMFENKIA